MKKNNTNKKINCNVEMCIHNNLENKECELKEIIVSCNCDKAKDKNETVCDSFKCNDITKK